MPASTPLVNLKVELSGTNGNADLNLLSPDGLTWNSNNTGSNETILFTPTAGRVKTGHFSITVTSPAGYSNLSIKATIIKPIVCVKNGYPSWVPNYTAKNDQRVAHLSQPYDLGEKAGEIDAIFGTDVDEIPSIMYMEVFLEGGINHGKRILTIYESTDSSLNGPSTPFAYNPIQLGTTKIRVKIHPNPRDYKTELQLQWTPKWAYGIFCP